MQTPSTALTLKTRFREPTGANQIWESRLDEIKRTQLIGSIATVIRCAEVPPHVRQAALTVIGWLAQRKRYEKPCRRGLVEAKQQWLEMHSE